MRHEICIPGACRAELRMAERPAGIVVLVHGSGSDRHDAGNRYVAATLVRAGLGALLVDLLDDCAARERHDVFDVELQAERLAAVKEWLRTQPATRGLRVGYFGTGIGAGVALMAAARSPRAVSAVVCRGGRPDTALHYLPRLEVPVLFIAAGASKDPWVDAAYRATAGAELVRIAEAGDSFREPHAITAVARHACRWFSRYLGPTESCAHALEEEFRARHPGSECRATVEERVPRAYERKRFHARLDVSLGNRSFVINREHDDDPVLALSAAWAAANRELGAGRGAVSG
jgi:putative phosphoribosyl transferase